MIVKDDWRLTNQMNYLSNSELIYSKYNQRGKECDHDHCEFCMKKFYGYDIRGYCTVDHYHWICEECFEDFKEMFDWKVR